MPRYWSHRHEMQSFQGHSVKLWQELSSFEALKRDKRTLHPFSAYVRSPATSVAAESWARPGVRLRLAHEAPSRPTYASGSLLAASQSRNFTAGG